MERLLDILNSFPKKRIIVIGDVMLDKTIIGDVSRISPEAPVQIVNVKKEIYEPGGAANVAMNVSSLGGNVSLFGFVGKDDNAKILLKILEEKKVCHFLDENSLTTLKLRIRSGNHQLLRIDYEETSPKNFSQNIIEIMKEEINNSDIILISDYAKGTITPDLMNFLKSFNKKIIINPKPRNMHLYHDSFLIICNKKEALEMSIQKDDVYTAGRYLKENLNCNIIITRGEKGMVLFSDIENDISTDAREVYDVMGAGDTVIAALSLSLASGASLEESMVIANHAAGISVSKVGTYQVKLEELSERISGEEKKIRTFDELCDIITDLRKKGKRIVWTNGKFDILHEGHVKYLKGARKLGHCLIAGLNSDSSFSLLKGRKPINSELERAEVLSPNVDYIIIFPEQDSTRYLSAFKPEVYAKGGNYTINTINQEERQIVESYGGEVVIINTGEDISTTKIIERIRSLEIREIKHVEKIWGEEIWLVNNEKYCGKKLILKRGKRCSFHYHKIKDETFYLESGKILIEIGNETKIMDSGEVIKISPGIKHRFSGLKDSVIVEISTSHDEEDSYRVEGQFSGDVPEEIMRRFEQ